MSIDYRHDVTKVGDFYNGGLWEQSLTFVGSIRNFVSGCILNVPTHHENFSSKKTSNKKEIANKPLTNLYEMNSNYKTVPLIILNLPTMRYEFFCRQIVALGLYGLSLAMKTCDQDTDNMVHVPLAELQIRCVKLISIKTDCIILSPIPMLDHSLESLDEKILKIVQT